MSQGKKQPTYKICFTGMVGVGKTACFNRLRGLPFSEKPGLASDDRHDYNQTTTLDDKEYNVNMQVWDTAGMDRHRSLTESYYRSSKAIIVVFSFDSSDSFNCVRDVVENILKCDYAPGSLLFLVGNKDDIKKEDREVHDNRVEDYLAGDGKFFTGYKTTSAKIPRGITELFDYIAHELIRKRVKPARQTDAIEERITGTSKGSNCCNY